MFKLTLTITVLIIMILAVFIAIVIAPYVNAPSEKNGTNKPLKNDYKEKNIIDLINKLRK